MFNRMPTKIGAGSTSRDMRIGDQNIDNSDEIQGCLRDRAVMRYAHLVTAIQLQYLTGYIECNRVTIDNDRSLYFRFHDSISN